MYQGDFDQLVAELRPTALALSDEAAPTDTALVFNCQMGRGPGACAEAASCHPCRAGQLPMRGQAARHRRAESAAPLEGGWCPHGWCHPVRSLCLCRPYDHRNGVRQHSAPSGARLEGAARRAQVAARRDERGARPSAWRVQGCAAAARTMGYLGCNHVSSRLQPYVVPAGAVCLSQLQPYVYPGCNHMVSRLQPYVYPGVLQLLALMDEELRPAAAAGGGEPATAEPRERVRRSSSLVMPAGVGLEAKLLADECIDACAHAQNMVEAVRALASRARGTAQA